MMVEEDLRDIAGVLGRPLNDHDWQTVPDVQSLSPLAIESIRRIASRSKILAVKYMAELVPNTRLGILVERLEELLGDPSESTNDAPNGE